MTRRNFLKTLGIAVVVAVSTMGNFLVLDHHFTTPNQTLQKLSFVSLKEAQLELTKLEKSDFENNQGKYEPHVVYGFLSRYQYEKAHYLHLADHLSGMKYS